MKTKSYFAIFGLALTSALLIGAAVFEPNTIGNIAHAASDAISCVTVGAGLKPSGQQCSNFTLSVDFSKVARKNHDHFGQAWTGSATNGLSVTNNGGDGIVGTSPDNNGVFGKSSNAGSSGVYGENLSGGFGTAGRANGKGIGVWGDNTANGPGVLGTSINDNGVKGVSGSGTDSGVYGENLHDGYGVAGRANGKGIGVYAENPSPNGYALQALGKVTVHGDLVVEGGGYLKFSTVNGNIIAADCDSPNEVGRVVWGADYDPPTLFICTAYGWRSLTPEW